MSGSNHSMQSTYRPIEGTGSIHITFPDVRKSSRKNAEELVNKRIASLTEDYPGRVITAELERGERFASIWSYKLSTQPAPTAATAPETT